MKAPGEHLVFERAGGRGAVDRHEIFWRASRGNTPGSKSRRQQAVGIAQSCRIDGKGNGPRVRSTASVNHGAAGKRKDAHAVERGKVREQVDCQIIGVGAQTKLWIIAQI